MPVYVRKHQTITPATFGELSEDEEDYITDPDQIKDSLPQPYRMVDKLLRYVYDDIWQIISEREDKKVEEISKVKAPRFECAVQMQLHGKSTVLKSTADGKYLFVGLTDGVAALDASSNTTIAQWEVEGVEISSLHISKPTDECYLLSTVDDMGIARMFIFHNDRLYLQHALNEKESNNKVIAVKCEASAGGEYIALALENPTAGEAWIEVFRVPRDSILKELQSLTEKQQRQASKAATPLPDSETPIELSHPDSSAVLQAAVGDDGHQSAGARSQSPASSRGGASPAMESSADIPQHKFSKAELLLKIKQPAPLAGISSSSPYSAFKTVDQSGDVIGSGNTHLMTRHHIEQRNNVFNLLHEDKLKLLQHMEPKSTIPTPTFHFLNPGRMIPWGQEHKDEPSSLAVWWTGGTQLLHYSLLKTSKEVERKPDVIWPSTGQVVHSCVSPDTSLVALALDSGNVAVWDKYLGMPRRVQNASDSARITRLEFLNPAICPQDDLQYPPYKMRAATYLLVCCDDGSVKYMNCGMGDNSPVTEVPQRECHTESISSLIHPLPGLPQVVLNVKQNGRLFLQDILTNAVLCEMTLPQTYECSDPWQPVVATPCMGQLLYVKATKVDDHTSPAPNTSEPEPSPGQPDTPRDKLFVFQLRSFPTLDKYWRMTFDNVPYNIHTESGDRINALLTERIAVQSLRQSRMQERWFNLKGELDIIQQIHEATNKRTAMRSIYGESTISRTPLGQESIHSRSNYTQGVF
ncbi:unnamed protein product [Owenia fusiformis]|uniref:WD repeat-containing protein 93 n=1 Tax=Owenia fusiformis TaxID=6347 RepID=A0A8S4PVD8_OWEFU|nr:unnamed protein product [Owenia fusiformis]